jgi:hypothetical protein
MESSLSYISISKKKINIFFLNLPNRFSLNTEYCFELNKKNRYVHIAMLFTLPVPILTGGDVLGGWVANFLVGGISVPTMECLSILKFLNSKIFYKHFGLYHQKKKVFLTWLSNIPLFIYQMSI